MKRESKHLRKNPAQDTKFYPHPMGDRHPGEAHMEHHEKPLENEHLHDGHDKDRVQTNIKGGA